MKKYYSRNRYDDNTGMGAFRATIVWAFAISLYIGIGAKFSTLSTGTVAALIVLNTVFLVVDTILRVQHYRLRKANEQVRHFQPFGQVEQVRYVSNGEKATYWAIRISVPIYILSVIAVSAIYGV